MAPLFLFAVVSVRFVRPLVKSCNALFLAVTLERAQASSTDCWVRNLHWSCGLLAFCNGQSHVREIKAHFEVKVPDLPASMLLPLQSPMVIRVRRKWCTDKVARALEA
jgi:hypothetical protein